MDILKRVSQALTQVVPTQDKHHLIPEHLMRPRTCICQDPDDTIRGSSCVVVAFPLSALMSIKPTDQWTKDRNKPKYNGHSSSFQVHADGPEYFVNIARADTDAGDGERIVSWSMCRVGRPGDVMSKRGHEIAIMPSLLLKGKR